MVNFFGMTLATTIPFAVRAALTDTFMVLMAVAGMVMTVLVMMQSSQSSNLGAIAGGAETFFGKSKAKSMEGKLSMWTLICGGIVLVFSVIYFVIDNLPLY